MRRRGSGQAALDRPQRRLLLALQPRRAVRGRSRRAPGGSARARIPTPTPPGRGGRRRRGRTRPPGRPTSRNEIASDAPSRPIDSASPSTERATASRSACTYGFWRETIAGARVKHLTISRSAIARIWARISPGSWLGRKRMSTSIVQRVGHLVERVAADDPREVDRRAVEQVRDSAAERQRLDAPEGVVGLEDRVVAQPRRRAVRRGAADLARGPRARPWPARRCAGRSARR